MDLIIKNRHFYIPSIENAFMLIKFESPKYINSFLSYGTIHFGSTQYYREIELKKGNVGIGDKYDGLYSFSDKELKNMSMFIDGYNINTKKDIVGFNFSLYRYIFCMSILNIIKIFTNANKKNELKRELRTSFFSDSRFPKKIVIITNPRDFFNKLDWALILMGYNPSDIIKGRVIYSNHRNYIAHILSREYDKYPTNRGPLFWINFVKNIKFRNEKEFRICIPSLKTHPTGLNIPIGCLKNDVIIFNTLDDFINRTSVIF